MRRSTILCTLCAVLLAACSSLGAQAILSAEQAALPNFGTTTVSSNEVHNATAREQFLEAYQTGQAGRCENVAPTVEGDPIVSHLLYAGNGTQLQVMYDTGQDGFGQGRAALYTCAALVEDERFLQLIDCSDGSDQTNISIPTMP